jgi:hypothetical protein
MSNFVEVRQSHVRASAFRYTPGQDRTGDIQQFSARNEFCRDSCLAKYEDEDKKEFPAMLQGGSVLKLLGLPHAASRLDDQNIPSAPCTFLEARDAF